MQRAGHSRRPRTKSAVAPARDNVVHLRTRSPVQGFHVLAEWYVASLFQQFEPDGVVATVVLSDAHIAIHTWPDTGLVAIDFYACHLDASSRARAGAFLTRLREVLRPVWVNATEVNRGVPDAAPSSGGR